MIIATNVLGTEMIAPTMIITGKMDGGEMIYKNKIAVSEWISVNERLPEECKEVLVTIKDDSADSPIYYTAVGWYYAGIWVVEDAVCHQVIAWMKPPKPYKEEE